MRSIRDQLEFSKAVSQKKVRIAMAMAQVGVTDQFVVPFSLSHNAFSTGYRFISKADCLHVQGVESNSDVCWTVFYLFDIVLFLSQ